MSDDKTIKDKVFIIYEKTLNKLDDLTEYREINRKGVKEILTEMNEEIMALKSSENFKKWVANND